MKETAMANLQSTKLGNWAINEIVSNAEQISDYAESAFLHKDGTLDAGNINLSGNINVGYNN